MRILLIDDDQDLSCLTKTALTNHGYEVSTFLNAESGIKYAKIFKPHLILMDLLLPGVNGADAVHALKKDPQLKEIPVVFLTALISRGERNLENMGINVSGLRYQILGKPYEIEKLLKVIQKVCPMNL